MTDVDTPMPCCDYRDHASGVCPCPDHDASELHPFGYPADDPSASDSAAEVRELRYSASHGGWFWTVTAPNPAPLLMPDGTPNGLGER